MSKPIDDFHITLTEGDPRYDLGLSGTVNRYPEYSFDAKVYDVPSEFGIGGGRVSKLEVRHERDGLVARYSRGWDKKPQSEVQVAAVNEILAGFADERKLERLLRPNIDYDADKVRHDNLRQFNREFPDRRYDPSDLKTFQNRNLFNKWLMYFTPPTPQQRKWEERREAAWERRNCLDYPEAQERAARWAEECFNQQVARAAADYGLADFNRANGEPTLTQQRDDVMAQAAPQKQGPHPDQDHEKSKGRKQSR